MDKLSERLGQKSNPVYESIGAEIQSKESVVGIDARHTHILIIKKLLELEEKIDLLLTRQTKKETEN